MFYISKIGFGMGDFKIRTIPGVQKILVTPQYVDDAVLADIGLGDCADRRREIRGSCEGQGMPTVRRSAAGLYYLPALLRFFDAHGGLVVHQEGHPGDSPDIQAERPQAATVENRRTRHFDAPGLKQVQSKEIAPAVLGAYRRSRVRALPAEDCPNPP